MTNEEMDRRIAEHFGADCMAGSRFATWPVQAGQMLRKITVHVAQSDERDGRLFAQIPNFSTDFTAMREAEQALFTSHHDAKDIFIDRLCRIMDPVNGYRKQEAVDIIDATAEQHALAFVETIKQIKQ